MEAWVIGVLVGLTIIVVGVEMDSSVLLLIGVTVAIAYVSDRFGSSSHTHKPRHRCSRCGGSGQVVVSTDQYGRARNTASCPDCGGSG